MAARSTLANAAFGTFAPRTIFIKASPPPLTFAERRAVLHALKRHCRIDFFRKIRNNPSSFLSLTESEEAARSLISRSPLRYQLSVDPNDLSAHPLPQMTEPSDSTDPSCDPTKTQAAATGETAATTTTTTTTTTTAKPTTRNASDLAKEFVIHIFPRHMAKKHVELVEDSPLHGPWPGPPDTVSFVARNLRRSIRDQPALKDGFSDWETGGQLQEDGDAPAKAADIGPRHYAQRRQKRREAKKGLGGILEDF